MATLRSIWIWAATGSLILLWLPLLAVVRLLDRDSARYTTGRWFRRLGAAVTRVNPNWKIEVSGTPVSDPRRPYVVVCNHQSLGDIPIISRLPWEMKWVAKAELFRIPVVGWMMRLAGDIPVDRDERTSGARAFVHAKAYLAKKCSVMFFPEGTRSPDGKVHAFTDGAFRLAIKTQTPILPLALDGAQDALPKHSWKFGTAANHIRLRVMPPIETTGLKAGDTEALRERVRAAIAGQIAAWRGVPVEAVAAATALAEGEIKDSVNTPAP
ncbi:MAG TPA: lysophospholipid acyltransferase family protein [Rhodothermales bacterium]|nr:lysophospholipid acyltransferase family protein [Rhodothermales bacterium]